jgi:hypothetical protein
MTNRDTALAAVESLIVLSQRRSELSCRTLGVRFLNSKVYILNQGSTMQMQGLLICLFHDSYLL